MSVTIVYSVHLAQNLNDLQGLLFIQSDLQIKHLVRKPDGQSLSCRHVLCTV